MTAVLSADFIWLGAGVNLAAGAYYVVAAVRPPATDRTVRPNPISWGIWSLTGWIAAAGQLAEGAGLEVVLTLCIAAIPSAIFIAALASLRRYGPSERLGKLDYTCGVLSLLTLALWQVTASGHVAIALSIGVDAIVAVPVVIQAYRAPQSDHPLIWLASGFNALVTLLTLSEFTLVSAAFGMYLLVVCAVMSLLLVFPTLRYRRTTPLQRRTLGWMAAATLVAIVVVGLLTSPGDPAPAIAGASRASSDHQHEGAGTAPLARELPGEDLSTGQGPVAAATSAPSDDTGDSIATSVAIPTVRAILPVAATPGYVALTPDGRQAWIMHRDQQVVSVLDATLGQIVATIRTDAGPPRFVTFCGGLAWISVYSVRPDGSPADELPHVVAVIDTATLQQLATIPVGRRPFAAECSPDGRHVVVPSHDDGRLDVIDPTTMAVVREVPVPPNPHWVAHSGDMVWAANHESNVVTAWNTDTYAEAALVRVGTSPHSIAISPDGTRLAVVCFDSDDLWLIDTGTAAVSERIPLGDGPQDVAWTADGARILTADVDSDAISVIDAATGALTAQIPTGDAPTSVATSADGRTAYVTNLNDATVVLLDTAE